MNTKIFNLLVQNLHTAFHLPKYANLTFDADTQVQDLPWTFEVANKFAELYNLHLDTYKKDANDRLYFVYTRL